MTQSKGVKMHKDFEIVKKVIIDSIGWAKNKDRELLLSCMAQDKELFYFSPDAEGTIEGFDAFVELVDGLFMDDRFKAVRFEVKDLRINFSKGGDTAWFSCFLDDFNEFNGRSSNWENARWTGVLEKRENRWVIVQMHFSFAK